MPKTADGSKFTHESVQRALITHQMEGRVRHWSPPDVNAGDPFYRIDLYDYGSWRGRLRDAFHLVVGLRVGALATEALRDGKALAYREVRCVRCGNTIAVDNQHCPESGDGVCRPFGSPPAIPEINEARQ